MSISISNASAAPFGYNLSSPSGSSAAQAIRSSEAAAVQSVGIAASQAVNTVKIADAVHPHSFASAGGSHHQISVPTDLSALVKGG